MEDKLLEMCKEVVKAKIIPCENKDILCRDCIFNVCEDCKNYKITSEIAQNYINEHEKTVNTIEKKITLKELQEIKNNVEHPQHYTNGKYECINVIEDVTKDLTGLEAVCTANVIKYMWRWKLKNGVEDLKKARWYLNKLIDNTEGMAD